MLLSNTLKSRSKGGSKDAEAAVFREAGAHQCYMRMSAISIAMKSQYC